MHYRIPGPRFFMLPVTDFAGSYADEKVVWSDSTEVEFETKWMELKDKLEK